MWTGDNNCSNVEIEKRRFLIPAMCLFGMMFLFAGCPAYIPWNPLYQGAELDRELTFNIEDIGVRISSLVFYCGNSIPRADIRIKNFSPDTLYYDFSKCKLIVKGKTHTPEPIEDARVILPPGRTTKRIVQFPVRSSELQDQGENWVRPISKEVTVTLILGMVRLSDRIVKLPSVDYRHPYKGHRGTKFP